MDWFLRIHSCILNQTPCEHLRAACSLDFINPLIHTFPRQSYLLTGPANGLQRSSHLANSNQGTMTLEEFILSPHRPYLASRATNKSIHSFLGIYCNVKPYFTNPSCFGFKSHQLTTIYCITVQDVGVENMIFRSLPETFQMSYILWTYLSIMYLLIRYFSTTWEDQYMIH